MNGTTLKLLRIRANLSQIELAEKLNISQGAVTNWECGKSSPRASLMPALAKALGCTIDDLYRKED